VLSGGGVSRPVLLDRRPIGGAAQPLFCLHYYHGEVGSSNELEHARRVAERADAHLYEVAVGDLAFAPVQPLPRAAKPYTRYVSLASIQHYASQLADRESSTMISGHGGDALFLEPPLSSALADAALTFQWRSLARIAMDLALIRREPLAKVVSDATKSLFSSDPSQGLNTTFGLLADAAREEPTDGGSPLHPAMQRYMDQPLRLPGRSFQLFAAFSNMNDMRSVHHPFKRRAHFPFLCQPMVELALSIPSYRHFEGANTRIPQEGGLRRDGLSAPLAAKQGRDVGHAPARPTQAQTARDVALPRRIPGQAGPPRFNPHTGGHPGV
jgi:asparagine synthase (glutamine-hydrolysing)